MAEVAVMVIDPAGNRFAQLVDDRIVPRNAIPLLVGRLGLPTRLNYSLVADGERHGLPLDRSLAASGVRAGARLRLVPARDGIFHQFMDELYDEAKEYVQDQLWDLAKEKMDEVLRTNPDHPDPAGVSKAVQAALKGATAAAGATATGGAAAGGGGSALGWLLLLVVAGGIAYAYRAEIGKWWAKQQRPGAQQQAKNGGQGLPQPGRPANEKAAFGVFVVGPERAVYCAQRSVMESNSKGQEVRMVLGPFATAQEARNAYEADKIPGSERGAGGVEGAGGIRLLGHRVARFRFDGQEHRIDGAFSLLR